MQVQEVDFHEVFKVSAIATALLTPDLVIIDANDETALEAALISGEREVLRLTRYDFEDPARPGVFEDRYWSSLVTPVYADDGELKLLELSGREVTSLMTQFRAMLGED